MLNPIALQIGPLSIHWYGIAYLIALVLGYWILTLLNKKRKVFKNNMQILDLIFWIFLLGVILGGRLGYVLFYNFSFYLTHPIEIFSLWKGGMSFHGGLIGSLIVSYVFFRKNKINFLKAADLVVIVAALAQGIGRIGNFINRELIGRPIADHRWDFLGMDFGDGVLRYPSQLFQSAEAFLTFLILLFIFSRKPKKGVLLFSYLILNGGFRVFSEFFREPDMQIGFLFGFMTLGQLLGVGVLLMGILGFIFQIQIRKARFLN